ncbi:MAG TPA: DUF1294 domain-containing protein [Alphaproteobacteria bacterium]|nr:DUF1294 domain-containing protein [Alphaproteobacteria bacterium]
MSIKLSSLLVALGVPAALTLVAVHYAGGGGIWWWLFYANLNLLALLAKDKLAAVKKGRRTPESTLLLLALAGASPALLGGRFLFRHKTAKQSFIVQMCGVMVVQAGLLWYFWPQVKAFI